MSLNEISTTDPYSGKRGFEMGTLRAGDDEAIWAQPGRPKQAFLSVIHSRADIGQHHFVDGPTLIGRHPSCRLALHDLKVSGRHATITPQGPGQFLLEDLRSTNGTYVNGNRIEAGQILHDGDKICLGATVIRFSLADDLDIHFHSEVATLVGTDPLTGLPSKRRFDDQLDYALQSASRSQQPLALLMMDMDGVKQINDQHGHLFGAHVIKETGRLIARELDSKGRACRFGGDEFSAFVPRHDTAGAAAVGERIRQAVESAGMVMQGIPLRPTISIGVASYPQINGDILQLISAADAALYRAKAKGKNCVSA